MTPAETSELMAIIAEEHPKFLDTPNPEIRFALWAEAFEHVPYDVAAFAIKRMLIESPFTPRLSDVAQRIKEISSPENDNSVAAWNALHKATARASVVTREEFDSLPYEVKRFCGSLSGLRDLGMLDAEVFNSVTRGQFTKVYDGLRRAKETLEIMPPEVRALTQQAVNAIPMSSELKRVPGQYDIPPVTIPYITQESRTTEMTAEEWAARRDELVTKLDKTSNDVATT